MNIFVSLQLTKNDVELLTIEISSKKVRANKSGFLGHQNCRKKLDISARVSTWKKVRGNNVDISTTDITSKKNVWTTWIFRALKLQLKGTLKPRGFFDQRNFTKKSTWKRRGYFDLRKYTEKVRGNDLEFRQNLVFDVIDEMSTLNRRLFAVVCLLLT